MSNTSANVLHPPEHSWPIDPPPLHPPVRHEATQPVVTLHTETNGNSYRIHGSAPVLPLPISVTTTPSESMTSSSAAALINSSNSGRISSASPVLPRPSNPSPSSNVQMPTAKQETEILMKE